jgi:autotransporter strand-loop-strand O-heptosyltransferase
MSDTAPPASDPAPATVPVSSAAEAEPPKLAYPLPAAAPTQTGPEGIRFDFNDGCRVILPEGDWQVCLRDLDTGNIVYQTRIGAGHINSMKRYFIRFRIEISRAGGDGTLVLTHDYDARNREVLVQFPVGTLGDLIGWFPYAARFQEAHGCRLTCAMGEKIIPLFRDVYPSITFLPHEEIDTARYYATYSIGLFFDDDGCVRQPTDFRQVGLARTAGYILGVDPSDARPRIALPDEGPPIPERYVCIAVQSSTQCKYWNNPSGWLDVVRFLRQAGYRVVCIDQRAVHGHDLIWNHIPNGAEDETGDRPLMERARWLKHAAFFVGLSSGLAWLAWAVGTPVVMISGFTHPTNEFATPYRVINWHACNSCWNDPRLRFDHKNFLWCPRQAGTPRQFECSRLITPTQVIGVIRRVEGFTEGADKPQAGGRSRRASG